jgi:hypothetical protein
LSCWSLILKAFPPDSIFGRDSRSASATHPRSSYFIPRSRKATSFVSFSPRWMQQCGSPFRSSTKFGRFVNCCFYSCFYSQPSFAPRRSLTSTCSAGQALVLSEVEGSAPACRLQVRALRPFACRGRFLKPPSLRRAGNTSRIIPSLQYTCAAERTGKLPRGGFGGSIHPWYSSARGLLTKSNCFWRGCPFCQSATRHRPQPISFSIHHLRSAFR